MGKKNAHLNEIKESFDKIHSSLSKILNSEPDGVKISHRSLSGDHIYGGKIVKFCSTGITDNSSRTSLIVTETGITTPSITTEKICGDVKITGNLVADGEVRAEKLHVNELTSDVRITRASPLEFKKEDGKTVYNLGLYWVNSNNTHQLILRDNPDRLWSTASIDLNAEQEYLINGITVLGAGTLGPSIRKSNLSKVGILQDLQTNGNLTVDNFIFYETAAERVGIGTEAPNATLSVSKHNTEFVIEPSAEKSKIGNWTTHDLDIITDDTSRIHISGSGKITFGKEKSQPVSINGSLGINVKNPDADLCIAGSMKISGKQHSVGTDKPSNGTYTQGDIVWNGSPKPSGYVGWICVRSGTPGEWKPFGAIAR